MALSFLSLYIHVYYIHTYIFSSLPTFYKYHPYPCNLYNHNLHNKKEPKQAIKTPMAVTMRSKGLLFIFIIFFVFFITSDANQVVQNNASNQLLLRKLGMKVSDLEYYKRRSLGVIPGRLAPGGPDGQHHFAAISPSFH